MKPPKVIYIGAADYEVRTRKTLDLLGETDNTNTEIMLKRDQSAACRRDTLLHEVMHAVVFLSGYGHDLKHADEERLVRTITPWILAVLRDNPELVDFLLES